MVAEPGEFAGEVPYVDALAAAERVPLVREESDPQRTVTFPARVPSDGRGGSRGGALAGACFYGLSGHSRPPSSLRFAGA
ncbi:hypothetical protein GCM10010272_01280 [Streptomyces lateritius]|nr:hypothetical protein GCM10010272_01280 [Streptomyces lateritius]